MAFLPTGLHDDGATQIQYLPLYIAFKQQIILACKDAEDIGSPAQKSMPSVTSTPNVSLAYTV